MTRGGPNKDELQEVKHTGSRLKTERSETCVNQRGLALTSLCVPDPTIRRHEIQEAILNFRDVSIYFKQDSLNS